MDGKLKAIIPAVLVAGSALLAYGAYRKYFGASATLPKLLKRNRQYSVQYKGFLSNHLSMALIALERLGASRQQLEAFNARYITRLEPRPPASEKNPITANNWRDFIGKQLNYQDFVDFFRSERSRLGGTQPLLAEYLPPLLEGVCAVAFHALLLLGYALDYNPNDHRAVVEGLAYIAFAYRSLGPLPAAPSHSAILRTDLRAIRRDGHFDSLNLAEADSFHKRMAVLASGQWPAVLDRYDLGHAMSTVAEVDNVLVDITRSALELYELTNDFFVLHIVTGLQALKTVLPYVPLAERPRAVRYFWRATVAAYVGQGAPVFPPEPTGETEETASTAATTNRPEDGGDEEELPSWDSLKKKAVVSYDEHIIKFVYTCWRESEACTARGDEKLEKLFRKCAATKAGVLTTITT